MKRAYLDVAVLGSVDGGEHVFEALVLLRSERLALGRDGVALRRALLQLCLQVGVVGGFLELFLESLDLDSSHDGKSFSR